MHLQTHILLFARRVIGLLVYGYIGLFIISCTHDSGEQVPVRVPVRFSPVLSGESEVSSRATNGNWEAGDKVGIYMVPHAASGNADFSTYTDACNVPYVTSGSGSTGVSLSVTDDRSPILYPFDKDKQVNFVGYYPYNSAYTTNNYVYKVNVAKQSPSKEIDLLYHRGRAPYNRDTQDDAVQMEFSHRLSKMMITLRPASDAVQNELRDATVTLSGFPTTADFNLSTGVLSAQGGTGVTLTPVKGSRHTDNQSTFEALLIPHSNGPSLTRTVTFKIGNDSYPCELPTENSFEVGVSHLYQFVFTGSKIVLSQNIIIDWDGGSATWGKYVLTTSRTGFDLLADASSGHTVTISTNAPDAPDYILSNTADDDSGTPNWITSVNRSNGTDIGNGWKSYTLTFGTLLNSGASSREGFIRVKVGEEENKLTLAIRVTQSNTKLYVNDPNPASFAQFYAKGASSQQFTIKTNTPDEQITVSADNTALVTNLTSSRGAVAGDGSSTWTIGFDVAENATTSARSGKISVTIAGITKTVSISQEAMYVNNPSPTTFANQDYTAQTGLSFTIQTNSLATTATTSTNNTGMITSITPNRGSVNATTGVSTWTFTFALTENPDEDYRLGVISVNLGGHTRTVSVTQDGAKPAALDGDSNCFMVKPGSSNSISFYASRPVSYHNNYYSSTFEVEKLWDDTGCISSVSVSTKTGANAVVTVVPTSIAGNAVIALKDKSSGVIVWSYHIWVVDYDPDNGPTYTNTNNDGDQFIFMDRNLGATFAGIGDSSGTGLYYQWGRKDPFPATGEPGVEQKGGGHFNIGSLSYTSGTFEMTIKNPNILDSSLPNGTWFNVAKETAVWGARTNRKTVYDPCPQGWKVPCQKDATSGNSPWSGMTNATATWVSPEGISWGANAVYPYKGYRSNYNGEIIWNTSNWDRPVVMTSLADFTHYGETRVPEMGGLYGMIMERRTASANVSVELNFMMNVEQGSAHVVRCVQE